MFKRMSLHLAWILPLFFPASAVAADAKVGPLVARIKAVGREGAGNPAASSAWQELVELGPSTLLDILAALDDAEPAAANWLRAAVDTVAERAIADGRLLDQAGIEAFVRDTRHSGPARRLAYEWLARLDAGAPGRLLPGMLNDPGAELRRAAVELAMRNAQQTLDAGRKEAALELFRKVLASSRERDQVDVLVKKLKELNVEVDVPAHYGFIQRWLLIGPFDNTAKAGFDKVFPPEERVDLSAACAGKKGATLRWIETTTEDPQGMVDLNQALGKNMGATAYAYAAVDSSREQPVQIRAGSNNAVKIYLNGKQIYFRDEYHHGLQMDQHVGLGTLRAGRNEILIKVCQNEQTDKWAQSWGFQLRVCDALGGAVPVSAVRDGKQSEGR